MDHHKIEFFAWLVETLSGSVPLPFVSETTQGLLNEWYRSRRYTTDRAVWLATNDRALACKNILYGCVPFEMLGSFTFGTNEDTFLAQVREQEDMKGLSGTASKIVGMMQRESWMTNRYIELDQFIQAQKGGRGYAGNESGSGSNGIFDPSDGKRIEGRDAKEHRREQPRQGSCESEAQI